MSRESPAGGIEIAAEDIGTLEARWSDCWSPSEVARRLAGIDAPWCVVAGWALDLFRGSQIREHGDIEIAVPAGRFAEIRERLSGYVFDAVGDMRIWENAGPSALAATHQTWVRDPRSGSYLLDVFREPHDGDTWICRRDEAIRCPHREIVRHSADGIPYLAPEYVLLFKAKHVRGKDQADFEATAPFMTESQRERLAALLRRVHPGHPWIAALEERRERGIPSRLGVAGGDSRCTGRPA